MAIWQRVAGLNLVTWIIAVFLFHGILYFLLETPNWLYVTVMATLVWAIGLLIIRSIGRALVREKT